MKKAQKLLDQYFNKARAISDKKNAVFFISTDECSMNCRRSIRKLITNAIAIAVTDQMLGVITQEELDEILTNYIIIQKSLEYRIG